MLTIRKPTLVLNSRICRENIQTMAYKAHENHVLFRPHFKTHQSAEIGAWFREQGVFAITVSSVSMAKYFALHGWTDITIAFPANICEIDEMNQLASSVELNLLIESADTAQFLSKKLTSACGYFIKIDMGYHRTGIAYSNTKQIDFVLMNSDPEILKFRGFLTHNGNTYHSSTVEEISRIQKFTAENLVRLRNHYVDQYPDLVL